jgi:signal transduction histidine kinase
METTTTRRELDYLVRTLSHDMNAYFMLLESSFAQLKESLGGPPPQGHPHHQLSGRVAHVEACLRESRRFLDDLVQLARTGRVEMEPSRVELSAVVDEVLFEQHEFLALHNVAVDVQPPLPVVWCNHGRLKQIVTNLVRNAVHHGCDAKQPRITISAAPPGRGADRDEDGMAAFVIHDNGPGIERQSRREIFLPGKRLPKAGGDGSGMGLAIVKKIVEHYGGQVYVDPQCQAGTTFVVSLPQPAGRTGQVRSSPETPAEQQDHRWRLQLDGQHKQRPGRLHRPVTRGPRHHR